MNSDQNWGRTSGMNINKTNEGQSFLNATTSIDDKSGISQFYKSPEAPKKLEFTKDLTQIH